MHPLHPMSQVRSILHRPRAGHDLVDMLIWSVQACTCPRGIRKQGQGRAGIAHQPHRQEDVAQLIPWAQRSCGAVWSCGTLRLWHVSRVTL